MRSYLIGIIMPLLTLFFFSCKKGPADGGPYTFYNRMNDVVNLNLYPTKEDYMYSRNALLSVRIQPQSSYIWSYNGGDGLFDKDAILYMDWYTDDYRYTNWKKVLSLEAGSLMQPPLYRFTRSRFGMNNYYINSYDNSDIRQVLINGNEPEVAWKACDAIKKGTGLSVWDTLSATQQKFELALRKDLSFRVEAGNDVREGEEILFYGKYKKGYSIVTLVRLQVSQHKYSEDLSFYPDPEKPSDSLIMSTQDEFNYILVRKQ